MKSKVTIRDVAYIAGVSISTVSRVVSGKLNVSEATLKKVQDAINKIGYEPNYTAKALATNSTDSIAVVIDRTPTQGFGNSFFLDALDGIANKLSEYKKDMILIFDAGTNGFEDEGIKRLISTSKIDACIKLSVQKNDATLNYLTSSKTPTVVVGRVEGLDVKTVNNDNKKAMKEATQYLIDKGCKKIAFVGGSINYIVTVDRREGFIEALKENNIKISEDDFYYTEFSKDAGYEVASKLLEKNYDAVACTDDLLAYGINNKYHEDDKFINIVSFNNTYLSEISDIPISSVDINAKILGEKSVELLFDDSCVNDIIVEANLIIRS